MDILDLKREGDVAWDLTDVLMLLIYRHTIAQ